MANAQAILMVETQLPLMMNCADGGAIAKGDALKLSGALTVVKCTAADDEFGGIAAEEKIANDGKTQIAVYRDGIFKVEVGDTGCSLGMPCKLEAVNEFTTTAANNSDIGYNFGIALEAGTDGQFILMELGRGN